MRGKKSVISILLTFSWTLHTQRGSILSPVYKHSKLVDLGVFKKHNGVHK